MLEVFLDIAKVARVGEGVTWFDGKVAEVGDGVTWFDGKVAEVGDGVTCVEDDVATCSVGVKFKLPRSSQSSRTFFLNVRSFSSSARQLERRPSSISQSALWQFSCSVAAIS